MDEVVKKLEAADIAVVLKLLPHRYPFLMVDRVIEMRGDESGIGIKNVTINEPHFTGHFPGFPIMPGVLMVEAMAQAGCLLLFLEIPDRDKKLIVFSGIERAKFRKPVTPGDQLRIEVDVLVWKQSAGKMQGRAYVGDKLACEATISCVVVNR